MSLLGLLGNVAIISNNLLANPECLRITCSKTLWQDFGSFVHPVFAEYSCQFIQPILPLRAEEWVVDPINSRNIDDKRHVTLPNTNYIQYIHHCSSVIQLGMNSENKDYLPAGMRMWKTARQWPTIVKISQIRSVVMVVKNHHDTSDTNTPTTSPLPQRVCIRLL